MEPPFEYTLPENKIAERPVYPAGNAKLLVVDRKAEKLSDSFFHNLANFLELKNTILVFNQTKVIPARLFGDLAGKKVEVLLLKQISDYKWRAIGRPTKYLKSKQQKIFFNRGLTGVIDQNSFKLEGEFEIKFSNQEVLKSGVMPIPPYIRKGESDEQDFIDYQTVFAQNEGSIAAPTASLHFSEELNLALKKQGAIFEFITLHVGSHSFKANLEKPLPEFIEYDTEMIKRVLEYKQSGKKILAVGTTVVRALESIVINSGSKKIETAELFIKPGFNFKIVDQVITNFHQPGTTHMYLVEALLGRSLISNSYEFALKNNYRFLSYGDGMLIL